MTRVPMPLLRAAILSSLGVGVCPVMAQAQAADGAPQGLMEPIAPISTFGGSADPEVEAEEDDSGDFAKGWKVGLTATLGSDDNIFRSSSNRQSSGFLRLKPTAHLTGIFGKHRFQAGYRGDLTRFSNFRDESYNDHTLSASGQLDLTRKLNINLGMELELGHDARGGVDTRTTVSSEPDTRRNTSFDAEIVYGRREARAQILLGISKSLLRYTNNAQSSRDYDTSGLRGSFYYRVGATTYLVVDATLDDINYLSSAASSRDSSETGLSGGVGWRATARTSGEFTIGRTRKEFDSTAVEGFRGGFWRGEILWEAQPYSKVTAWLSKDLGEGGQATANYYVGKRYGLEWRHGFSNNTNFRTGADWGEVLFSDQRADTDFRFHIGLDHQIYHWLNGLLSYEHSNRRSSSAGLDYRDNMFMLSLKAVLDKGATAKPKGFFGIDSRSRYLGL